MKTSSRFVVVALALAIVLGGLFFWKYRQIQRQQAELDQPPPPAIVEATTVAAENWEESLSAIGSLRAVNAVQVANEIAGVVEFIEFESGQQVEDGDVLIRLNTDTDRAALDTLKADARLALQEFHRASDLLKQRAVSESQFDQARATLDAAEARVNEQQARIAKKIIRAPFAGRVGLRLVDLGEFLEVGTPIVEIGMLDPIYADFTLPERDFARIAIDDRVEVRVIAWPDQVFSGRVLALQTSMATDTRTIEVRAELANAERLLRPGMFANVTTFRDRIRNVLTVPRTAISYNTYGDFVFVITRGDGGQQIVERRRVETGEVRDGRVELVAGASEGDRVVAAGLLRLRNLQPVQVVGGDGDSA